MSEGIGPSYRASHRSCDADFAHVRRQRVERLQFARVRPLDGADLELRQERVVVDAIGDAGRRACRSTAPGGADAARVAAGRSPGASPSRPERVRPRRAGTMPTDGHADEQPAAAAAASQRGATRPARATMAAGSAIAREADDARRTG